MPACYEMMSTAALAGLSQTCCLPAQQRRQHHALHDKLCMSSCQGPWDSQGAGGVSHTCIYSLLRCYIIMHYRSWAPAGPTW